MTESNTNLPEWANEMKKIFSSELNNRKEKFSQELRDISVKYKTKLMSIIDKTHPQRKNLEKYELDTGIQKDTYLKNTAAEINEIFEGIDVVESFAGEEYLKNSTKTKLDDSLNTYISDMKYILADYENELNEIVDNTHPIKETSKWGKWYAGVLYTTALATAFAAALHFNVNNIGEKTHDKFFSQYGNDAKLREDIVKLKNTITDKDSLINEYLGLIFTPSTSIAQKETSKPKINSEEDNNDDGWYDEPEDSLYGNYINVHDHFERGRQKFTESLETTAKDTTLEGSIGLGLKLKDLNSNYTPTKAKEFFRDIENKAKDSIEVYQLIVTDPEFQKYNEFDKLNPAEQKLYLARFRLGQNEKRLDDLVKNSVPKNKYNVLMSKYTTLGNDLNKTEDAYNKAKARADSLEKIANKNIYMNVKHVKPSSRGN
ncbi:MAG: hypothetical protein AB7V77_03330 [Candidatus Woesearchaeota archaeon]